MHDALQTLKSGVRRFQEKVYPAETSTFHRLESEPQRPHTLFITCADSRIDPAALTQTAPGELFTTRNVGNMVPSYHGETLGGTSAVIEYAVAALKVQHVVVCGHSDCGAMKALQQPQTLDALPAVKGWLRHAPAPVDPNVLDPQAPPSEALRRFTERNVLLQMQHLKTHPAVAGALEQRALTLSGWVYDIGSGDVRVVEDGQQEFVPIAGNR